MAELKTQKNEQSVSEFINSFADKAKLEDCRVIAALMEQATGSKPALWGDSIIGFGEYQYHYNSGREASWMLTGFSPRKQNLTLYIMSGFDQYESLLRSLGKYKTG
jgi:hypothetical protein